MERKKRRPCIQKLFLGMCLVVICLHAINATGTASDSEHNKETVSSSSTASTNTGSSSGTYKNNCGNDQMHERRSLLLVSTMDGRVSALNLEKEGQLEWSIDSGVLPLISSTISKLEVTKNGKPSRLVPSLDGSLFQFDGESIEALPFTADTLLSSSFKLNQDSTIVGGKESITYGIELRSGKIRYVCSTEGCSKFDVDETTDTEDVIILTRHTKTVRAVEMRSGLEKWNFSVGQHDVALVPRPEYRQYLDVKESEAPGNADSYQFCDVTNEYSEDDDWFEYLGQSWFGGKSDVVQDLDLKVIIPQGLVVAMSRTHLDKVSWQYKFGTPIAQAWTLHGRELTEISLFDDRFVPALQDDSSDEDIIPGRPAEPMLYIGMHEKQIYVQPAVRLAEEVHSALASANHWEKAVSMPRVYWLPYVATAPSRTPAVTNHNPLHLSGEDNFEDSRLAIRQNQYPFDSGWYLMSDTSPLSLNPDEYTENENSFYGEITVSLWNWWREVLAISIFTSVVLNIIIIKCFPRKQIIYEMSSHSSKGLSIEDQNQDSIKTENTNDLSQRPVVETVKEEYTSRFQTEFVSKECLGRGGFGVVFEAINKVDDCSYAIKRITLINSQRAKEKVMREVKALAKLEHTGIVRYNQAWFENPPVGWQEKQDSIYLDIPSTTPTPIYTDNGQSRIYSELSGKGDERTHVLPQIKAHLKESTTSDIFLGGGDAGNPLKVGGNITCWNNSNFTFSDLSESAEKPRDGSGGYVPHVDSHFDDSESYSINFGTVQNKVLLDEVVTESVGLSDSSQSFPLGTSLPFSIMRKSNNIIDEDGTNNSFNIVFEDSGCNDDSFSNNTADKFRDNCWSKADNEESCGASAPFQSHSNDIVFSSAEINQNSVSRPNSLPLVNKIQSSSLKRSEHDPKSYVSPSAPKLYLYIQMQLCQRESLKDWLNSNTLSRDRKELLNIFDQIVSAVDYIHRSGLMHRDLKPSNIFFSLDGFVKVGDFGLVTTLEESSSTIARTPVSVNHTGQVGTRLYMSPEQAAGQSYNHKVDIYALGLIFFELFYPFATQMERIKILLEARKSIFPFRFSRELPDECTFVKSMLELIPDKRPSTQDIQRNKLLYDFEVARQSISRVRPRTRTTSSSGSGNSLSSLH